MAKVNTLQDDNEPAWRQRAVSRSLSAARSRAQQRVQRFLDAAFELIDEKDTTEFTIQEVVERSKQSLRAFYQYFDGKDELILALFEETVRQSAEDIRKAVEAESDPIERLRVFTIRLHEWRGSRRPIAEFTVHLAVNHPERVNATLAPVSRMLFELLDSAVAAGAIKVADTRRTAVLMLQTLFFSWFGNRLIQNARMRVTAEEIWEFCLHGLRTGGTQGGARRR
jgi:AcrR family transcriptional regulator